MKNFLQWSIVQTLGSFMVERRAFLLIFLFFHVSDGVVVGIRLLTAME